MTQPGIPASHLDLFNKKAFAHLATVMVDGKPQVTPVWVDYDGRHVLINTAEGRLKDKNMQRDGRIALLDHRPGQSLPLSRGARPRGGTHPRGRRCSTSMRWRRSTSGRTSTRFASPARCACIYKVMPERSTSM